MTSKDASSFEDYQALTKKIIDFLDCTPDFYHVEYDSKLKKNLIHTNGYYYCAGMDFDENYRGVEFTWAFLDPDKLRNEEDYYNEVVDNVSQYIGDFTLLECAEHVYEDMEGAIPLPMMEVTDETDQNWYCDTHDRNQFYQMKEHMRKWITLTKAMKEKEESK